MRDERNMALIIYIYEFRGQPNRLHLAAELTNIPKSSHDPYSTYVSYYAYKGSQTETEEMDLVRKTQQYGGVGGSGACYMFQTPFSIKGFGAATQAYDKNELKLQKAILLPTKQDGSSSPIDEEEIAKQWKEARSWTLKNGEEYNPGKMYKQSDSLEFKMPFRFNVETRHCGTLIQNIITAQPLHAEHKETTEEKMWLFTSLKKTADQAQELAIKIALENKEELVKYNDLNQEYLEYRKTKSFWQSDSPEMAKIKKALEKYKHFDFVPASGLVCKAKKLSAPSTTAESSAPSSEV